MAPAASATPSHCDSPPATKTPDLPAFLLSGTTPLHWMSMRISDTPGAGHQDDHGHLRHLLTPKQRARLEGISSALKYPHRGQIVYGEGQVADALYFLDLGMVELTCQKNDGDRHIVAFLSPGDLFGLSEDGRYLNTVRTLAPTKLYRLPLAALQRLLVQDARLQLLFLTKAAHELRKAQRQMIVLGQRDPLRRMASFLLEFLRSNQYYDPDARIVSLLMSRQDIADYLALTQESVSRALARMEADGLIRRQSPRIIRLEDLRALNDLATY